MKTDLDIIRELLQKPLTHGGDLMPQGTFDDLTQNPEYTQQITNDNITIEVKEFTNIAECGNYLHQKFTQLGITGYNNPNSPHNIHPLEPTHLNDNTPNSHLWAWLSAIYAHIHPIFVQNLLTPQEHKAITKTLQIKNPQNLFRLQLCYILTQKIKEIDNLNQQLGWNTNTPRTQ